MCATASIESGRPWRDWSLGLRWVLASAAGMCLPFAIPYALMPLAPALVGGANVDRALGYLLAALLLGCVPLFQWLVLRRRMRRSGYWLLATDAGLIATWVLWTMVDRAFPDVHGPHSEQRLAGLVMYSIMGLCLGVAQWAVLRRHLRMPGLWVAASVLGYVTVGLLVGESLSQATDVIAIALMPAIWTGLALALLWKRPEEQVAAVG